MKKKLIRLTESDIHKIVKDSVCKIIKEGRGRFGDMVSMVTEKFNQVYAKHQNEIDNYINELKESGDFKDLETRISWDLARVTKYMDWMPKDEQGFVIGNDAQLTTLFKQALRNSDIKY